VQHEGKAAAMEHSFSKSDLEAQVTRAAGREQSLRAELVKVTVSDLPAHFSLVFRREI